MERDNFYILLELAFDPPVTDAGEIREALRKKKQEWTRMQDNPARRTEALRNLGLAQEIEKILLDPNTRKKEVRAAKRLREKMMRQFEAELRLLEGKGYLTPKEASALIIRYKAYAITRETLDSLVAVPISEALMAKEEEEDTEMLDRVTAENIQNHLAALGYDNLYAFLEEAPYASLKKLTAAADKKRKEAAASGNANQATLTAELAAICINMFANLQAKQRYDRYRRISLYPELNRLVDEEFGRSQYISPTAMVRLVNFGIETYGGKVLDMEDYIRRYCASMEYPVDTDSPVIKCPACQNKTKRSGGACTVCGAPLKGECPGCGTPFEGGIAACSECGFPLAKMGQGLRHIAEAEAALIENNWSTAKRAIQYAKQYWPGHPVIDLLEKRSILLEERYERYIVNIKDCVEHNQYYAALELIEEAEARHIRLPGTTVEHVRSVTAELEIAVEKLQKSRRNPSFETMYKLASTVSDSIDLNRLMAAFPPEAPTGLVARTVERQIHLEWNPSIAAGTLNYVLVRKTGAKPLTAYDGDILYEGPATSFIDHTAAPLQEHYYAVYTRRVMAYSKDGCHAEPLRMIPSIEHLRILPADMGAQLTWDFNPDIREVQVWRKLGGEKPISPGDGIQLTVDRLDGFSDTKIKNDVEYWYYLVAVYIVDGVKIYSKGVCESIIPHQIIAPIEELAIARVDEEGDEYVINWESHWNAPDIDVVLLTSPKPPKQRVGAIVPVTELLEEYRRMDMEAVYGNSARFNYRFSGGVYLFAIAVYGKFATVGKPHYLINVAPPKDVTYDMGGNDVVYVNFKWPANVNHAAVVYRFDEYPVHPDDPAASVLLCSKQQYEYDAGIVLRNPQKARYYARVYSVFTAPDGRKSYSEGVELCIDNAPRQEIFYKVDYTKSLFSRNGKLTLTVETDGDVELPAVVLTGKIGCLPLQQSDGTPLFTIEKETRVKGVISFEYNSSSLPKDLHVRLFLREEEYYDKFRFLPTFSMKLT